MDYREGCGAVPPVRAYSCRLHHINFFEYLSDILNRMSEMPNGTPVEAFRNLLPNKWTKKEQSKLQLSMRKRFSTDKSLKIHCPENMAVFRTSWITVDIINVLTKV